MEIKTITKLIDITQEKAKKVFYIVLKKKPLHKEIIEEIESKLENKMIELFIKIEPKLKQAKFENEEKSLKYIILKGLILNLQKELEENKINLTEKDKNTINELFNDDNDIYENKIKEDESEYNLMENENNNEKNNESWLKFLYNS
jgi:hypothetical protein